MARRTRNNRSNLDRLFDPDYRTVQLDRENPYYELAYL